MCADPTAISTLGMTMSSLPTEILSGIFSHASTETLVQLSMVCLRFHTVAFQILKPRLQAAALRDDLQLHLLCTPPGTESPVLCHYLGTDVPPDSQISGLYTRFRPEAYPPKRIPLIPPAKLIMCILGTDDFRLSDFRSIEGKSQGPTVRRIVLEDFDHFFQLQTKVDLALSHGKPYIVPSFNIHQSLLRVRREWLEEQTGSKIIWIDTQQGIGLRVLPRAKGTGQPPNIDFDLDIEELIIRGTRLLETVDQAEAKRDGLRVVRL